MLRPFQCWTPFVSLMVMWMLNQLSGSGSWNQWPAKYRHHNSTLGLLNGILDTGQLPFYTGKIQAHHFKSEGKPAFRRTLWCSSRTDLHSSIILLKKEWPGLTTQQAFCNWPIRGNWSLLVPNFRVLHFWISLWSLSNLTTRQSDRPNWKRVSALGADQQFRLVPKNHQPDR